MTKFIETPLTKEQEADYLAVFKEAEVRQAEIEAKEAAKLSAVAKLAKLGLTEDEAKAIVGI